MSNTHRRRNTGARNRDAAGAWYIGKRSRKLGLGSEELGLTCPKCGDLCSWNASICPGCNTRLALDPTRMDIPF